MRDTTFRYTEACPKAGQSGLGIGIDLSLPWQRLVERTGPNDTVLREGGLDMSTQWFFMSSGWFRKARRVGPISEADLLSRIDKGEIAPETLVQSSKTRHKWVPMNRVGPAMARWKKNHTEQLNEASN